MIQISFELVGLVNRFKRRSILTDNGHWLWKGSCNKKTKHGYIKIKNKQLYIHRYIFCRIHDLDYYDTSFLVCHSNECNIPNCWNPEHLYKGTHFSNMKDWQRLRTTCIRGHEFNKENTLVSTDGKRHCRVCSRMRDHNRKRITVNGRRCEVYGTRTLNR